MRITIFLLLSFASANLLAQTKEIAFKSHSGNKENFKLAINDGLFDKEDGGFGLPTPTVLKTYKLDSVFYVSDTVSVIVIREYQKDPSTPTVGEKLVAKRKDTLYHDALLARKHSLDSIRSELSKMNYYNNPVKSIVFVGYDNKKPKQKRKQKDKDTAPGNEQQQAIHPVGVGNDDSQSPFDGKLVLMLGTILLLSLLGGWISWKFYQPRFR